MQWSLGGNKLSSLKSPVKGMKIERSEIEERGRQCCCCQEIRMGRTTLTKGRNWRQQTDAQGNGDSDDT